MKPSSDSTCEEVNSSGRTWICLALALGLCFAWCWPLLQGEVYTSDDLGEFHLPLRQFYAQQLEMSEPFDWMPTLYSGFFVTGEGQLGGYHPLHRLLYQHLPLSTAFNLEVVLSYLFLFAGTYLLLRLNACTSEIAVAGGIAFTCCGFCALHFVHPNAIAVVAHLPWLLAAICTAMTGSLGHRRSIALASIALLTGSQILLGYPQYVWYSMVAEMVFAITLWIDSRRDPTKSPPAASTAMLPLLFKLSGFLIGGVQILPTIDALISSNRTVLGDDFFANASLHPLNVCQFVAPYLFANRVVGQNTRELSLYCGAVPFVLAVWTVLRFRQWKSNRTLIPYAIVIFVVGLTLAMGAYLPTFSLLRELPVIGSFRCHSRAVVLVQFAVALLAAAGLASFARQSSSNVVFTRLRPLIVVSLVVAIGGKALFPEHTSTWAWALVGPGLVSAAVVLVRQLELGRSAAFVGLMALMAADLGYYGLTGPGRDEHSTLDNFIAATDKPPVSTARVAYLPDPRNPNLKVGNRILLSGFTRVDGYAGLEPLHTAGNGAECAECADWIRTTSGWMQPQHAPCPRAELSGPGEVKFIFDRPGRIKLSVHAESECNLTVSETFHPDWWAAVDDQTTPLWPDESHRMVCLAPAGEHTVYFGFLPKSVHIGKECSLLGLLVTAVFALLTLGPRIFERRGAAT